MVVAAAAGATEAAIFGPAACEMYLVEYTLFTWLFAVTFGVVVWHVTQPVPAPPMVSTNSDWLCAFTPATVTRCNAPEGPFTVTPAAWHFAHSVGLITELHIGVFSRPWQYESEHAAHVPLRKLALEIELTAAGWFTVAA